MWCVLKLVLGERHEMGPFREKSVKADMHVWLMQMGQFALRSVISSFTYIHMLFGVYIYISIYLSVCVYIAIIVYLSII